MKRKAFFLALLAALSLSMLIGTAALSQDTELNGELVRLRVIAASDSEEDQRVKLAVRDAVLEKIGVMSMKSAEEAVQTLRGALPDLAACAQSALQEAGKKEAVQVRLCTEEYPVRDYGSFSLPAGEYVSLQVRIGEAEGQNWWCVIYPGLCHASDAGHFHQAAEAAGFTDGQICLMTQDSTQVQFRFKFLEILQKIKNFF